MINASPYPLLKPASRVFILFFVLLSATLLLLFFSASPQTALNAFYLGPLSSSVGLGNCLNHAFLLALTGLGACFAFQTGTFNLGGEGQTYLGAFFCTACGLLWPEGALGMILAITAGSIAGAMVAGASGIVKSSWNADEMITTYLISLAIFPIVDALLSLPLLNDQNSQLISSKTLSSALWFHQVLSYSDFHIGILIAAPLLIFLAFLFFHTRWGFYLKLIGYNGHFAQYLGTPIAFFAFLPLTISGGLHGLAGSLAVLGSQHALIQGMTQGWGWSGLTVALLAQGHPLALLPAAFFLSYLDHACQNVVLQGQFPYQLGAVFQALILFFITAQMVIRRKKRGFS